MADIDWIEIFQDRIDLDIEIDQGSYFAEVTEKDYRKIKELAIELGWEKEELQVTD